MDKEQKILAQLADGELKRIADAMEEILRLVKQDMERVKKLNDES
tara:strand:+ start:257 stop:391 length:135 start_codon:yes stop_codon:yes gene_type:complete